MEMKRQFDWAQSKVDSFTNNSKEHREKQACERRLKQMEARRGKEAKRATVKTEA